MHTPCTLPLDPPLQTNLILILNIGDTDMWNTQTTTILRPYKSDRNARRLALGYRLQILVSLIVFGMERHYICPFRYRLVVCIKKFTKNALTLTSQKSPLGGQYKLKPHQHWSPLGIKFEFFDEYPCHFCMGVPPGPMPPPLPGGFFCLKDKSWYYGNYF